MWQSHWSLKCKSRSKSSCLLSQDIDKMLYAKFDGVWIIDDEISRVHTVTKAQNIGQDHWSGHGAGQVRMSRRCRMQGLMAACILVKVVSRVDVYATEFTGAQNIGQDHWVKMCVKSESWKRCLMVVSLLAAEIARVEVQCDSYWNTKMG